MNNKFECNCHTSNSDVESDCYKKDRCSSKKESCCSNSRGRQYERHDRHDKYKKHNVCRHSCKECCKCLRECEKKEAECRIARCKCKNSTNSGIVQCSKHCLEDNKPIINVYTNLNVNTK